MDKLFDWIRRVIGSPWFMKTLGGLGTVGGFAILLKETITVQGVPADMTGLVGMVMTMMGLGQLGAKPGNVTHATQPLAVPQAVTAEPGAILADPPQPIKKP